MKIVRALKKGIFNFILCALLFLLLFSFCSKSVFNSFIENYIGHLQMPVQDTEYGKDDDLDPSLHVEKNYTFAELMNSPEYQELLKNPAIQALIDKYVNMTINGVTNTSALNDADLGNDILRFLLENKDVLEKEYGLKITNEDIEELKKDEVFNQLTTEYVETVKDVSNDLSKSDKNLIKLFNFISGTIFKIILLILIIVDLVVIAVTSRDYLKWINMLGFDLLGSGVMTIIMGLILHFSINSMIAKMKLSIRFDFLQISLIGLICCVIAGLIILIYYILDKKFGHEKIKYLYDDVYSGSDDDELEEYM